MKNFKVSIDVIKVIDRQFYNIEAETEEELFEILDNLAKDTDRKPYLTEKGNGKYPGHIEYAEQEPDKLPEDAAPFKEDEGNAPSFIREVSPGRELHMCQVTQVAFIGDNTNASITLPFANSLAYPCTGWLKEDIVVFSEQLKRYINLSIIMRSDDLSVLLEHTTTPLAKATIDAHNQQEQ